MQRSFIDRIFPHSSPLLPQHERSKAQPVSLPTSPTPSLTQSSQYTPKVPQSSPLARSSLQNLPLAASVIHHADPLLPIDRAAKSLERHIQSLLDAQSEGLLAGLGNDASDDLSSTGSLTPTPSVSTPSRTSTGPKIIPVRQPAEKRITLRQARRGLKKSMQDFVRLKSDEMTVLDGQYHDREEALHKVRAFEDKRAALEKEADSVSKESGSAAAEEVRQEAQELERTIRELEDKLMEMKARHRQLLDRASQLGSAVDSKLSSYKSSIAITDMEIRKFLRNPPIQHGLPDHGSGTVDSGMYALRPERRTLEMAQEQWKSEQEALVQRRRDVEVEQTALEEGSKMWQEAVQKITAFEKQLKAQTNRMAQSHSAENDTLGSEGLLVDLTALIESLESDFAAAETKRWNLLICALGAELEALRQGRDVLERTLPGTAHSTSESRGKGKGKSQTNGLKDTGGANGSDPTESDLMSDGGDVNSGFPPRPGSGSSNQSLEDTLREFGNRENQAGIPRTPPSQNLSPSSANPTASITSVAAAEQVTTTGSARHGFGSGLLLSGFGPQSQRRDSRSESEDDDPGPEFFLSH